MRYNFKSMDLICYSVEGLGSHTNQMCWFVRYGRQSFNFHRAANLSESRSHEVQFVWKYDVIKSKVVLGLYK